LNFIFLFAIFVTFIDWSFICSTQKLDYLSAIAIFLQRYFSVNFYFLMIENKTIKEWLISFINDARPMSRNRRIAESQLKRI